jgi:hypothetical protein
MQGEASAVLVPRRKQKMTDCFRLPGPKPHPVRPPRADPENQVDIGVLKL